MTLFGQSTTFGQTTNFGGMASTNPNPNKDVEVTSPPSKLLLCIFEFRIDKGPTERLRDSKWEKNLKNFGYTLYDI